MSNKDPILAKADALMRRHRVFVAHGTEAAPETAVPPPTTDEDIPLLTDVVDQIAGAASLAASKAIPVAISPAELQRWIDEELPATVLAVLDGVTDKLVEVLTARLKHDLIDAARHTPGAEQG